MDERKGSIYEGIRTSGVAALINRRPDIILHMHEIPCASTPFVGHT